MAEQTFKSPGFFEREIEVITRPLTRNTATPVGVIGPAQKGQAFVPKTVTSVDEFIREFGMPDQDTSAAHAISEFFANKTTRPAATFCRILGTGKGSEQSYAGFKLDGTSIGNNRAKGAVQFIVAQHEVAAAENVTYGIFNDNDSITTEMDQDPSDNSGVLNSMNDRDIQLVRAMIFMHKDYTLRIANTGGDLASAAGDDSAVADGTNRTFVLHFLNTVDNSSFSRTVSLDPSRTDYISKVLNTDSFSFTDQKHFLYADFPVEEELASTKGKAVSVLRGTDDGNLLDLYGDFSSRFSAPRTTSFISQPFGDKEYDLFHFESLDDGTYASQDYKISISNLRASTEKNYKFGTFSVQLRKLTDTDESPIILESYGRCSLDPDAKNFIGRLIGDQKVFLNLDVDSEDEKRLVREGTFSNKSSRIRVVLSSSVLRREIPDEALPFGFRGIPALRTTSDGKDGSASSATSNLIGHGVAEVNAEDNIRHAILPPLPYRAKVTLGSMTNAGAFFQEFFGQAIDNGSKVTNENVKTWMYWGLHTTKVSNIENPNSGGSTDFNKLILGLTKHLTKSDTLRFRNEDADAFNNNKFTLAKVAFPHADVANISGTVSDAFLEAAYIRNADIGSSLYNSVDHTIDMTNAVDPFNEEDQLADSQDIRATMAKLLSDDPVKFNKYNLMAKYTAPFYGGFDGVNILDRDDYFFTDRASSTDAGGHAADGGYSSGLAATDAVDPMQGSELENNAVMAYRNAIRVMTDEMIVDHNVLVVPGIRDSLVTDFAARRVKAYGKAIYLMDIPHFDTDSQRIFVSSRGIASGVPDVDLTSQVFDQRELDSSYVATYFPDAMIRDAGDDSNAALTNHRVVRVPSSVVALGALAKTDSVSQPWFAPAGFSRGSLPNVSSIDVRLNAADRDTLYEARINPIANFPNNQFVIFGQKTTQIARTALDRVNVRRLMINIKRRIQKIAQGLLFEQNDAATRNRFINSATEILAQVRVRQGIEDFRVIMDDTNNTEEDVDNNRLNGRIIVVPTRAVEFIAMDFIITNSGVEFPS